MQGIKKYILFLMCFYSICIWAQEKDYSGDPDTSFFAARDLAFAGNRIEARDTLHHILSVYPDYTDVRVLLAKTYTWDKDYDNARKHFNKILSKNKGIKEVWIAAINNELYSKNYATALGLSNKALGYIKEDIDLQKQKQHAIDGIMGVSNIEAEISKVDSLQTPLRNQISIANSFEIFDVAYDPMFYSSIEYKRETLSGPIIPRINYSNRFNTHGLQYELDFYPKLSKTFYGYLNYGFSNATIYSKHRAGVEVYANYPKNMELSLGMRYMDFKSIKATIMTASVGLYSGNYYFSARPYVTSISSKNLGFSGTVLARKYLRDKQNYLGVTAVVGYSSELKQLRNAQDTLLAETVFYVESQQLLFEYQFTGKKNPNMYKANLGVARQELVFNPGKFFWSVSAGITYQVKF
ncbi:YaiO family outer membrane beta-barrel protein [uncultured Maribacter sp.]|uniref:YaiO family outer membrane beta-barrel protein n=1 Tax=uncultured Maribacter sp. TaxID=431308 RepID=UPI00262EE0B0|nr:YaiO family outer membrane beta-barrel protein [uncultured Maribacter sp.]